MRVLLTGATGFIGSRVRAALVAAGHRVVAVSRSTPATAPCMRSADDGAVEWLRIDLREADRTECWTPHLRHVDVVINAAGAFGGVARSRELVAVHTAAPIALFQAALHSGTRRVVQLSALGSAPRSTLGAGAGGTTPFLDTKQAADAFLLQLPLDGVVVRPSLVFGHDGTSSRWLLTIATMPWLALPDGGRARVQPIHVDDVVEALCRLAVGAGSAQRGCIDAVGPVAMTLADYLLTLRRQLGMPPTRVLAVPRALLWPVAALGDRLLPAGPLTRDALRMLSAGSEADRQAIESLESLLGRSPVPADRFVARAWRDALRTEALLRWLLPMLRVSLAFVWIVTGIVSLGVHPVDDSHAMLARAGIPPQWQHPMLLAAGWTDLLLGLLTLAWPRRWLWLAQAALIVVYSVIIAAFLPEFWTHPFGPLVKNVPLLALLWLLVAMESPPRR